MPFYQCPTCGRTVEVKAMGEYACKICGAKMRPVEAEAIALPAPTPFEKTIGELMRGMSEASRLGQWERYNKLKDQLNELTRSGMREDKYKKLEIYKTGIKAQILDERKASEIYLALANNARELDRSVDDWTLRQIAGDESRHERLLEKILEKGREEKIW